MTYHFYTPRRRTYQSSWWFARWSTPRVKGWRVCGFTWVTDKEAMR